MKVLKVSKEELYNKIIEYITENGLSNLTFRNLAKYCGVSVGTIYNYFGDKDKIVSNLMVNFWETKFQNVLEEEIDINKDFVDTLNEFYKKFRQNSKEFHEIFGITKMSGISNNEKIAFLMGKSVEAVRVKVSEIIEKFPEVKEKVLRVGTIDEFSTYIVNSIIMRMKDQRDDMGLFGIILRDFLEGDQEKK